jgi:hypothetical protein
MLDPSFVSLARLRLGLRFLLWHTPGWNDDSYIGVNANAGVARMLNARFRDDYGCSRWLLGRSRMSHDEDDQRHRPSFARPLLSPPFKPASSMPSIRNYKGVTRPRLVSWRIADFVLSWPRCTRCSIAPAVFQFRTFQTGELLTSC